MNKIQLSYCAGVIDCDGSIQVLYQSGPKRKRDGVSPHYYLLRLSVTQVDAILPEFFRELFGGTVYRYDRPNGGKGYWHTWHIVSNQAASCLEKVSPYLHGKSRQADAALRLHNLIVQQNENKKIGTIISDEHNKQRYELMLEVRRYNSRIKAGRNRELFPPNPV